MWEDTLDATFLSVFMIMPLRAGEELIDNVGNASGDLLAGKRAGRTAMSSQRRFKEGDEVSKCWSTIDCGDKRCLRLVF